MWGSYSGAERDDEEFAARLVQILGSVGRDVSQMDKPAQATAVAHWFRKTQPPANLIPYIAQPGLEVERRAGATKAAQFEPLFNEGWRRGYPALDELWPDPVIDVGAETMGLAASLGIHTSSEGLTAATMSALETKLKTLKAFATANTNTDRTVQVVYAHTHADEKKDELAADACLGSHEVGRSR